MDFAFLIFFTNFDLETTPIRFLQHEQPTKPCYFTTQTEPLPYSRNEES